MGYGDAIKRPFTNITKLVIGIVIMLIPIINITIGFGYFLRCAKSAIKRNYALPNWTDWGALFVTGIVALVISLIWAIPTLIVAGITLGAMFPTVAPYITTGDMVGAAAAVTAAMGTLLIGAIVTAVVAVIFGLLGTAAVVRYAEKGNFGSAFEFSEIKAKAFKGNFIAAWIVGIIYVVILSAILSPVLFIGPAIAGFICSVAFWTMVAEAYGKK